MAKAERRTPQRQSGRTDAPAQRRGVHKAGHRGHDRRAVAPRIDGRADGCLVDDLARSATTGRPEVAPWIRGWEENDPPQTELLWRRHLPIRDGEGRGSTEIQSLERELTRYFEAAPPHISEILETEAFRAVELLRARAKAVLKWRGDATHEAAGDPHRIPSPMLRPQPVATLPQCRG